jgi:hypothetical protein
MFVDVALLKAAVQFDVDKLAGKKLEGLFFVWFGLILVDF